MISEGVIPVAILTTDDFDSTTIDPLSVEFGPNGAIESHGKGHIEDVDEDGDLDLVLHFKTQETGIVCGDIETLLTGETFDGQSIEGVDSINTVGCTIAVECPCWDEGSIDAYVRDFGPATYCLIDDNLPLASIYFIETPPIYIVGTENEYPDTYCHLYDEEYGILINETYISIEEIETCIDILINSQMWELNCGPP